MNFLSLLKEEYTKRSHGRGSYSIRAFARDLGVDQSALSRILAGKRKVSARFIHSVAPKLGLSAEVLAQLISPHSFKLSDMDQLELEKFMAMSEWYHDAILELTHLDNFVGDTVWISHKLGLNENLVKAAIQRLQDLELLEISEVGEWRDLSPYNTIHPKLENSAPLINYQKQILKNSEEALLRESIQRRSHTSVTFPCNSQNLDKARLLIDEFRRKVSILMKENNDPKDEVYQLSVSLYPVTMKENKNDFN